jgi:FtsP/CotA-like multicopper oxidase with cupredoxin domain
MKMKNFKLHKLYIALLATGIGMFSTNTLAVPFIQCQGDNLLSDGVTPGSNGVPEISDPDYDPNVKCIHLSSGDGFAKMADGRELYIFSYGDITGSDEADAIVDGTLFANMPAPKIVLEEGQKVFLTLTNVGMILRPDLFDPHTVHFHGFPNASAIFDGVPDNSVSVNVGSSLTYFYNIVEPGTYMYHCHVEAAEHMQMGMLGNLYVKPAQNKLPDATDLNGYIHSTGDQYVYNDGDGSTFYDVEFPLQLTSLDPVFHQASQDVQPLPFAHMNDTYPLINGRGYPDTVATGPITPPAQNGGQLTQGENALITAEVGQKVLLRVSSLSTTGFYSMKTLGLDMKVIGMGAKQLRTASGAPNPYMTNTLTLGGGEAIDVIIDTAGVAPGTYFLYTSNLNHLSNDKEDFGGMMTEIVITAAGGA